MACRLPARTTARRLLELEESKLGALDFYFWQDGSAHKNRIQGNDFVQSVVYQRGMRCFDCHSLYVIQALQESTSSTL